MKTRYTLYKIVLVIISLFMMNYLFKIGTLSGCRDTHYTKIHGEEIDGYITSVAKGRYTSIEIDNAVWYDVAVREMNPKFASKPPHNFFEVNNRVLKKASNDTFLLIKEEKVYTCILP